MTNLFGALGIEIWDFIDIWCLGFEISEVLNTRYGVFKDDLSIGYRTVKFHTRILRSGFNERLQSFNPERGTVNLEPLGSDIHTPK